MVGLALKIGPGPILVATVAESQGLPPKFLRVLLADLKAARLVQVHRGPSGGCELTRHPSHISALEVIEAIEGRLGAAEPATAPAASAHAVHELWSNAVAAAREVLRTTTLADLAARQQAIEVASQGYSI